MKKLLTFGLLLGLCGCAGVTSKTNPDGSTTMKAFTFFDSQSALTKFQNRAVLTESNQWAPGTSIGSLNQSSTSTNLGIIMGETLGTALKVYTGKP